LNLHGRDLEGTGHVGRRKGVDPRGQTHFPVQRRAGHHAHGLEIHQIAQRPGQRGGDGRAVDLDGRALSTGEGDGRVMFNGGATEALSAGMLIRERPTGNGDSTPVRGDNWSLRDEVTT
jgi:hypothetical protein